MLVERLRGLFSNKRAGLRKPMFTRMYRWAIENDRRLAHAFFLSWNHILVVGLLIYATLTVHAPPESKIPWIFPLSKGVAALYEGLMLFDRVMRLNRSWKLNMKRLAA